MTAPVVYLPIRWSDIQAMPPSDRRDELAYSWRRKAQGYQARAQAEDDAQPVLRARAELTRAAAVLTFDDHPAVLAERRAILAAVAALTHPEGLAA